MYDSRIEPQNKRFHQFDSVAEAVAYARKGHLFAKGQKNDRGYGDGRWASGKVDDFRGSWSGSESYEEAERIALEGWSDQRPAVDAVLEPIREALADKLDIIPERMHDLIGYEPDIDRFIDGELECMFEDVFVEAPKMGKVFNMVINTTVNCSVSEETMRKRGAAIIALVEAFQMLGCDLNIWSENTHDGFGYDSDKVRWTAITRIHRAGENLDINNIMFPLGHPSWLRRLVFGMMENEANTAFGKAMGVGAGYGSAVGVMHADLLEASFVLSLGESTNEMTDEPVKWVLEQLLAQGVWDGGSHA